MDRFENYVNYAGSKTDAILTVTELEFENYVNYAGSKTEFSAPLYDNGFENYVNYAGSKTKKRLNSVLMGLRTM